MVKHREIADTRNVRLLSNWKIERSFVANEGFDARLSYQPLAAHVGVFGGEHAGSDAVLTG